MKKKIFKLTAKELKVLRAGRATAGCNGASWSASAARNATTQGKVGPIKPPPKGGVKPPVRGKK